MLDQIEQAAKDLTKDEALVLAHYARNTSVADISIIMEMSRAKVAMILDDKGRNSRQWADRVSKAWHAAAQKALSPAPAGRVTSRQGGATGAGSMLTSDVIGSPTHRPPSPSLHDRLRAEQIVPTPKSLPGASPVTVSVARKNAPAPRAAEPDEHQETTVTDTVATKDRAPDAEPQPVEVPTEDPGPDPEPEPAPVVVPPAPPAPALPRANIPPVVEHLLGRAADCDNADVQELGRTARNAVQALVDGLAIVSRAAMVLEQIQTVDTQMNGLRARREELRAELARLLDSDVIVTARSGRLRRSTGVLDPEESVIRAWALRQGFDVSTRGKLPNAVLIAYGHAGGVG